MAEWADRSVLEAASWRLGSELVRRHPEATRLLRTHPGGGQYDCLTITSSRTPGEATIQLNRNGSIQTHGRFDGRPSRARPLSWSAYLRADPRRFLHKLERAAGLEPPPTVPSATPITLTLRVLAALAATAVKSVRAVDIQPGYIDSSGYGGPNELLDEFPSIPVELRRRHDFDLFGEPGYRFWTVVRGGEPILAFEQFVGWAWTRHQAHGVDLVARYEESGRDVVVVALELLRKVSAQ